MATSPPTNLLITSAAYYSRKSRQDAVSARELINRLPPINQDTLPLQGYLAFEGIDGCGKTSLREHVRRVLTRKNSGREDVETWGPLALCQTLKEPFDDIGPLRPTGGPLNHISSAAKSLAEEENRLTRGTLYGAGPAPLIGAIDAGRGVGGAFELSDLIPNFEKNPNTLSAFWLSLRNGSSQRSETYASAVTAARYSQFLLIHAARFLQLRNVIPRTAFSPTEGKYLAFPAGGSADSGGLTPIPLLSANFTLWQEWLAQFRRGIRSSSFLLADRCFLSSLVYQFSTKLPEMWSMTCEDILPTARPEFIFWVDTPVEVAKTRRENRAGDTDAWEQGDMAARRTLYEDFYQESERLGLNIVRIDGTLPMHVQVREVLNHIAVDFAGNGGIDPTATLEDMDIQGLMMEGPYVPVLSTRLYPPPV